MELLAFWVPWPPFLEVGGLQKLTLAANLREQRDSFGEMGLRLTIIRTLPVSLLSCCYRQKVSFEFRNGTCLFYSLRAEITSASALKLLLMARVSLRRSPSTLDLSSRSEPARSTRLNVFDSSPKLIFTWKIEWLLELFALHAVEATYLFCSALLSS